MLALYNLKLVKLVIDRILNNFYYIVITKQTVVIHIDIKRILWVTQFYYLNNKLWITYAVQKCHLL